MKQSQIYPIYLAESNTVAQQIHMSFFDLEAQHSAASTRDSDQSASGADNLISQFAEELKQLGRECSKIATKGILHMCEIVLRASSYHYAVVYVIGSKR